MTEEQKKFIVDNWDKMSVESLRKLFNEKYNTSYKVTAFHYHTNKLGLNKFNSMHKYTEEEDNFLKENSPKLSRSELTKAFNKRFGLNIKEDAIVVRCCNHGWSASSDGRYDGSAPWKIMGVDREVYLKKFRSRMKELGFPGAFKKGTINGSVCHPVGTESIRSDGKIYRKVSGEINNAVWKPIMQIVWEEHNGEIPKGYHLMSVTGDINDTNIENLRIVSNATQILLMSNNWHKSGAEIFDAGVSYAKLYYTLREELNLSRSELLNKMKGVKF